MKDERERESKRKWKANVLQEIWLAIESVTRDDHGNSSTHSSISLHDRVRVRNCNAMSVLEKDTEREKCLLSSSNSIGNLTRRWRREKNDIIPSYHRRSMWRNLSSGNELVQGLLSSTENRMIGSPWPALIWVWVKSARLGKWRSWVLIKTFWINIFGSQEWLKYLPILLYRLPSNTYGSSSSSLPSSWPVSYRTCLTKSRLVWYLSSILWARSCPWSDVNNSPMYWQMNVPRGKSCRVRRPHPLLLSLNNCNCTNRPCWTSRFEQCSRWQAHFEWHS